MKNLKLSILALAGILFGCQQAELADPSDMGGQPMKSVTLSAEMGAEDTKAAIDSQTGEFSWQAGDVISVLATDGKFYDFTLLKGNGDWKAEFKGSIPEAAEITTVAAFPAFAANGTENTSLDGTTFKYFLPTEWTWERESSNVPMVATFAEASSQMSFKQVGGVMRFPVKNMPYQGSFVLSMVDTKFTGEFPIDLTKLGETAMVAENLSAPATPAPATKADGFKDVEIEVVPDAYTETLTIHYNSDVDGDLVEFNVPVPTGVYTNFNIEIRDNNGVALFKKHYVLDNVVERATLLNMSPVELPARTIATPTVWPYFVDARVVLPNVDEGETQYAVFVDGGEPVIKDIEYVEGQATVVCGGDFAHNSTHTVAIAKVDNGKVLTSTKSAEVEFTTGRVFQVTHHTGTSFVCAGWDDVAIGKENSTVYDETTKKWSIVAKTEASDRNVRGYRIQLYAEDKTTLLYDEVPFSSQVDWGGGISNSSWVGKINGNNALLPSALTLGWLEPGKKYYFRVQTLSKPVVFNSVETGCYEPSTAGYTVSSTRGGSAWSDFVEMTTDEAHVPSANEVLYESFDDMMFNSDIINGTTAAVPEFLTAEASKDTYNSRSSAELYKAWADKPFAQRKFSEQGFNTSLHAYLLGLTDDKRVDTDTPRYFNKYAGSLEGWSIRGAGEDKRGIYPNFGAVRIGQSDNATGYVELRTKPLTSELLSEDRDTKCLVTFKIGNSTTYRLYPHEMVGIYWYRGDSSNKTMQVNFAKNEDGSYKSLWTENYMYTDANNYWRHHVVYEMSVEMNLRKGDIVAFDRINPKVNGADNYYRGFLILDEVKIEVIPEDPSTAFKDDGVGTEPNDVNYDVYGLGKVPISYWWTIPTAAHNYDDAKTRELYKDMADAGINVVLNNGEIDASLNENIRIMNIAGDLGMKFIGQVGGYATNAERIAAIKENLATSPTYVGEYLADEPSAAKFDELGQFTKEYLAELPDEEVYINIFPMYAKSTQLGTLTYEDHVDQYLYKIPTRSMSFDYYGLKSAAGSLGGDYYTNLDMIRSKTLEKNMPFWTITQTGQLTSNRMPTEKEERWTVWTTLAGGSKGIAYFCYWDPWTDPDQQTHMVNRDGTKTVMYDWIKQINSDIQTISTKLLYCHADGYILTAPKYYPLYENDGLGRTNYGPIKAVAGSQSIACGCFRDARRSENGENYKGYKALVASQMPTRSVDAYLTLDPSVSEIKVTHIHTTETLKVDNTLNATVGALTVSFDGTKLIIGIPEGEAALIEF